MKIQPTIIAIIITAVGLLVSAPDSRAAGPMDNIPAGLSKAKKDLRAAQAVYRSGSRSTEGHAKHLHSKKTGR